jgi:nitrogen fixation protein FixH
MKLRVNEAQRWPAIVVAVLVGQIVFGLWMARLAGSDPHFAIEPDYYTRAVQWDQTMAQARRNQRLGWHATATLSRNGVHDAVLHVALTDSLGARVHVDSAQCSALPVAHANRVATLTLQSDTAGYRADIAGGATGLWDISVRAVRNGDTFTATIRTEAP